MAEKGGSARFYITALGEVYHDALKIEAWIKNRTMAQEGNSLLCSALMKREAYRDRVVDYLATKRGLTREKLVELILTDQAPILTAADYTAIVEDRDEVDPTPQATGKTRGKGRA